MYERLCGENASKHIAFATTMWAGLAGDIVLGSQREKQLGTLFWTGITTNESQTYRFDQRTQECAHGLINVVLATRDDLPAAHKGPNQEAGVDEGIRDDTEAGKIKPPFLTRLLERLRVRIVTLILFTKPNTVLVVNRPRSRKVPSPGPSRSQWFTALW